MTGLRPMLGHLKVEVIIVDGPSGSVAAFTDAERLLVSGHAQNAIKLLARLGRAFGDRGPVRISEVCSFDLGVRTVSLGLDPATVPSSFVASPDSSLKPQRDALWQAALVQALGYPATATLTNYNEDQRRFLRSQRVLGRPYADSVTVLVTKYGCYWIGYQESGNSEAVVVWWAQLHAQRPGFIGTVIAHEIGHVFIAPDEYDHCSATQTFGMFDTPNVNCVLLSPGVPNPGPHVKCLMDNNDPVACVATEAIWGWVDREGDGVADLMVPCDFTLGAPTSSPGENVIITGANAWDARVVTFQPLGGGEVTTAVPQVLALDKILIRVPADTPTWVDVTFDTRGGAATSSARTLFIVDGFAPPVSTEPIVWGVLSTTGSPPVAGLPVRILGSHLSDPTAITFGGVAADLATVVPADPESAFSGDSDITVELPPGVTGTVEVVVESDNGTSGPFPPFSQITCA